MLHATPLNPMRRVRNMESGTWIAAERTPAQSWTRNAPMPLRNMTATPATLLSAKNSAKAKVSWKGMSTEGPIQIL